MRAMPSTFAAPRVDFAAALAGAPDVRGMRLTALAAAHFPSTTEPAVSARVQRCDRDTARARTPLSRKRGSPFDFEDMMVRNGRIIAAEAWAMHRAYIEDPALDIDPVGAQAHARRKIDQRRGLHRASSPDASARRRRSRNGCCGRDALLTPTLPISATAARRGRRGDDTAGDIHARRQLSGRMRALAAGGIVERRAYRSRCS